MFVRTPGIAVQATAGADRRPLARTPEAAEGRSAGASSTRRGAAGNRVRPPGRQAGQHKDADPANGAGVPMMGTSDDKIDVDHR